MSFSFFHCFAFLMIIMMKCTFVETFFSSIHHNSWFSCRKISTFCVPCRKKLCFPLTLKTSFSYQRQQTRCFSYLDGSEESSIKSKDVKIPVGELEISFSRSSGPGGQNVNKVNTKAEMRFHVRSAEWVGPIEVRERLLSQQATKITKDGYLVVSSQEHR
jgi:hypothetical protein